MYQGKIIEYIEQGKFICTLCLADKGNRLHLLTPSNREINLSPKRALLISGTVMNTSKSRKELLEVLQDTEDSRNGLKTHVNVKELWELIKDENEDFDHRYLAEVVFGKAITDDHVSALIRALFEDHLCFKMKEGRFLPNSKERIEQIKKEENEKKQREEKLKRGSLWIKQIREGKCPDAIPFKDDIIHLLIQTALYGDDAPDFKFGKEMLLKAGISDVRESRNLLVELGIWEEDENLALLRFGIETEFTTEQLDESSRLSRTKTDFNGREDLRDLPTFTIDGPQTRDYDDALSLEILDDELRLGIHISDVASIISPESIIDQAALERAASLYLPRKLIPMIPHILSQDMLSLKKDCDRPTLSLIANFDKDYNLLDYRFVPSVIRVHHQLTYDEVDEELEKEASFQKLHRLSRHLDQNRTNQDALNLSLPELYVKFNENASLSIELFDQKTPARMIIAELMILYNWLAARFCSENKIPIFFRTQAEPIERFPEESLEHIFYIFQQRRKLSPLQISTSPNPHSSLGLDVYTQVSSPIRRYLDLMVQRQMTDFLVGLNPTFDEKGLDEIRMTVGPVLKHIDTIKRNRLRYWTIKFLRQNLGKTFRAFILDTLKSKYRIVLKDFFLVTEIKRRNGEIFKPGEEINVELIKADPWEDQIDLQFVGK